VAELSAAPTRPRVSGGQSAGAFLKGILGARPGAPAPVLETPAAPGAPSGPVAAPSAPPAGTGPEPVAEAAATTTPGSPTRPASDAISLDSVFGDEGGRGSIPALPEPAEEQAGKLPPAGGGFSFDDFFGTAAGSGASTKPPPSSGRPPRPSGGGRGRAPEQDEDLDQFQAWLKSLKA
jgi:hypothetical protein